MAEVLELDQTGLVEDKRFFLSEILTLQFYHGVIGDYAGRTIVPVNWSRFSMKIAHPNTISI